MASQHPRPERTTALAETRPRRAAIVNLGCKVNQSEMEAAGRLLRERGLRLVDGHARADLVLVNTCTVTAIADQKSRQAVRRARRVSPSARIVVTGCSVEVQPEVFAAVDPEARLVGNAAKAGLLDELEALVALAEDAGAPLAHPLPTLSGVEAAASVEPAASVGLGRPSAWSPTEAIDGVIDGRTVADRTRAFVKVQDGCSFYCTYCIIPRARGPERSLRPEAVLSDVRRALAAGHREIVLTGINIGTYDGGDSVRGARGSHRWSVLTLAGLIRLVLDETDVERIRLSSIEPQHVDDELLETWVASGGRCLPHFHLPLQSGDDGVLRRMGRRYDAATYAAIVGRIRDAVPGAAIHADVIAGFPTEDEAAFQATRRFLDRLEPAGLHVFRYSARPGTPAQRMRGQVPEGTRKARAAVLLAVAAEARARTARRRVGSTGLVLFEERLPDGRWVGHAEDHVLVAAAHPAERPLENEIGRVELVGIDPAAADRLVGLVRELMPLPERGRTAGRIIPVVDTVGRPPVPRVASSGSRHRVSSTAVPVP